MRKKHVLRSFIGAEPRAGSQGVATEYGMGQIHRPIPTMSS